MLPREHLSLSLSHCQSLSLVITITYVSPYTQSQSQSQSHPIPIPIPIPIPNPNPNPNSQSQNPNPNPNPNYFITLKSKLNSSPFMKQLHNSISEKHALIMSLIMANGIIIFARLRRSQSQSSFININLLKA
jgi:hypothetical protein